MKRNASEILTMVTEAITKKYDPTGKKVFGFAFIGQMSGKILNESIAILTSKSGESNNPHVLYVVSPQALDDYYNPLVALKLTPNETTGTAIELYYPETTNSIHPVLILRLIQDTLTNMGENWVHQKEWLG